MAKQYSASLSVQERRPEPDLGGFPRFLLKLSRVSYRIFCWGGGGGGGGGENFPAWYSKLDTGTCYQERMSTAKRCEGASNSHVLYGDMC